MSKDLGTKTTLFRDQGQVLRLWFFGLLVLLTLLRATRVGPNSVVLRETTENKRIQNDSLPSRKTQPQTLRDSGTNRIDFRSSGPGVSRTYSRVPGHEVLRTLRASQGTPMSRTGRPGGSVSRLPVGSLGSLSAVSL